MLLQRRREEKKTHVSAGAFTEALPTGTNGAAVAAVTGDGDCITGHGLMPWAWELTLRRRATHIRPRSQTPFKQAPAPVIPTNKHTQQHKAHKYQEANAQTQQTAQHTPHRTLLCTSSSNSRTMPTVIQPANRLPSIMSLWIGSPKNAT